jgi:hypothetical protein
VTVPRHRLPIRVVVLATMVMTAAAVTAAATVANHCGLHANSGTGQRPFTAWLKPERMAEQGRLSGPSRWLAGPSELLAGAG